jgi:tRNA (mo5U34)-methyltransferase
LDWKAVLDQLPHLTPDQIDLATGVIAHGQAPNDLKEQLMQLRPWRKGPFHLHGLHIDTEWRSDWKWDRLAPHIKPLTDRLVLDIGCGSGYHTWRIAGAGAKLAIGIDPQPLFICQYFAVKQLLQTHAPAWVLPMALEDIPPTTNAFDTLFSMGLLYHRKSPLDHLQHLHTLLQPSGELILETLIVEGPLGYALVPDGRYAKMRNVWFIPSLPTLEQWLQRIGFKQIRVIDITPTSPQEQRSTEWMTFESLSDFLDPTDPKKTIEGYPAPLRATLLAEK